MIGIIVSEKRTRVEIDECVSEHKKRKVGIQRRSARLQAINNEVLEEQVESDQEMKQNNSEKETDEHEVEMQSKAIKCENSKMSEYEIMRLKNIEENQKFFASLEIFKTKQDMLMLTPNRNKKPSNRGLKSEKKREPIIRRPPSLRLQRIDPSGDQLPKIEIEEPVEEHPRKPAGPLSMNALNNKSEDEEYLNKEFNDCLKNFKKNEQKTSTSVNVKRCMKALKSIKLTEERVAKVVPQRICSLDMHPSSKLIVVAGDKRGNLGFWDVDSQSKNDGVFLFEPHSRAINYLKFAPSDSTKLFSCSYDGTVRCGDLNKLVFDDVYQTDPNEDQWLSYMDLLSTDGSQLLIAQNTKVGKAVIVDKRSQSSCVQSYKLHERHVKTVSINPLNRNYFITASNDSTVALWDLRMLKEKVSNKSVCTLQHGRTVYSAFFSPVTGNQVLTTSADDNLRIANFVDGTSQNVELEIKKKIRHNNHTGRWLTTFKAQWHPTMEDTFVVGSMDRPRRIEIFSTDGQCIHTCMNGEYLSSVCSINAFHPTRDILIGGNSSGRVHVFM